MHSPTGLTKKQVNRQIKRSLSNTKKYMLKAEQYENRGSKVYTKPCGGLLVYQPVKGKAVSAATSKLDAAVSSRGALQKIQQLADEHNWTSDGKRNDPSLVTVITALMADELGQTSQQPQLQLPSGKPCTSLSCINMSRSMQCTPCL